MNPDRFAGCLLGLALGDALGAPFEGGLLERGLWRLLGTTRSGQMRWTDDTQMSLDLAESLVEKRGLDQDDLARRFAASYRWSRGYGPGAAKVLQRIRRGMDWRQASRSVYANGSYGNGGAMRASVAGLYGALFPEHLFSATRDSALITHSHPLAINGAIMIAVATAEAVHGGDVAAILDRVVRSIDSTRMTERLAIAQTWLLSAQERSAPEVATQLGNGMAALDSCVTALYIALRFFHRGFAEMHAFVVAVRGDVDTIAAMAGAIWGAAHGVGDLPTAELDRLEQRERIFAVANALYDLKSSVEDR